MPRLGIHQDFLQDLIRLERPIQSKVLEAIKKFEQNAHTGAHLEKLQDIRDPRFKSIRIDLKYRGIVLVPEQGDHFTLLKVDTHEEAYDWVRHRRATVNMATGHMEIRDDAIIDTTIETLTHAPVEAARPLFEHVADADLARLGIDDQMLKFARMLTDVAMLEALDGKLPQVQFDVLFGLAAGMSPEDVWDDVVGAAVPEKIDPNDLAEAAKRMPHKVALVEGPEELMELFNKPFARWRVYLHPLQREAAFQSHLGPAQVTGGPGTGKTVVALHRARHLARQGGRVLLATFTATLARSLAKSLRLLETDDEVLSRVDVLTVDQVARRHVGKFTLLRDEEEKELWRQVIRRRELDFTERFLAEEWRQVVLAQEITSSDGYLSARRIGRGRRLGSLQRAQVWRAIAEFEQELAENNYRTFETVCVEATRAMRELDLCPYDHVIVDEAQDLHPVRWRVVRAAVAKGANDLFLASDTHQRIYDNRVSLSSVGIQIAGRSTRLKINYRTTEEILAWSCVMLAGEKIDDLDGSRTGLTGCRSEVHGDRPKLYGAATRNAELSRLVEEVRTWLDAGVLPEEIGVATRSETIGQAAVEALRRARIDVGYLSRDTDGAEGQVRVTTMHRMKGLEFRCVAVIGVGVNQLPAPSAVTPREEDATRHANDLQRERCLLFVACTRARERLHVSWHGDPSSFLNLASG
ncbi:UvrD-helicase domain-containing protein [Nonomuraea endophytica]|uniref:DNA 3'-5' helicase n=1 Tax=Nonomuraea endophytica TaxID=714136 RepID=A0A7W7ZZC5_9ACTN|nr:UvrD-helicase domain-containing protein [Nonomuraea endophytica]MBB5075648.1 mRNA-degrading endonuclease RelE of RelBE toxin-antitoxin system [Nonomuraea endophytica]